MRDWIVFQELKFEIHPMIARVTLEIALRKEFDYSVPAELAADVTIGTRVKVPFGPRLVSGVVTDLPETSPHTNLKAIASILGVRGLITPGSWHSHAGLRPTIAARSKSR